MAASSSLRCLLPLVLLSLLCGLTAAREFLVGGDANAWSLPSSSQALNKWAEANRFRVGDSLVWKYDAKKDWVLQVRRDDYLSCNRSAPLAAYRDGSAAAAVELAKSGPYYFIGGAEGGCGKGQKLIVVVMSSERRGGRLSAAASSPAPSPAAAAAAESEGPAVAPASGGAAAAIVGRAGLPVALAVGAVVLATSLAL